ncbi:O-antigen ligase family protein [Limnobacter sp.]|uniref:O-antigen ligase family protein n=1 Tax=Limnobacter sp. TaxID=2003368 RepID=UPI002582C8A4|nr:O-antigen ligase family protein [Limnobacter sp.]
MKADLLRRPAFWLALSAFFLPIKPAPVNLFLLVAVLLVLGQSEYRGHIVQALRRPDVTWLCVFTLGLLATYAMPDTDQAAYFDFVHKYGRFLLVPLLVPALYRNEDRGMVLRAFLSSMGLTLLLSWLIWAGANPAWFGVHADSEYGIPANPTVYKLHITQNFFMVIAIFYWLQAALDLKDTKPAWSVVYGLVVVFALINVFGMVQGRTGWIVFAVIPVVFFARRMGLKGLIAGLVFSVAVLALSYLLVGNVHERVDKGVSEVLALYHGGQTDTSMGERYTYMLAGWSAFLDAPWIGHGVGGVVKAVSAFSLQRGVEPFANPHNQFLLILIQSGLVGLFAYLLLLGLQFRQAIQSKIGARYIVPLMGMYVIGNALNSFHYDFAESMLFIYMTAAVGLPPEPSNV